MNIQHKILKIYILVFTSVLLLFCTQQIIIACGGGDDEDIIDYSAFAPEIIEQPQFSPFFFTYAETYPTDPNYNPLGTDEYNLNEWYTFFDNKITKDDLAWFVYSSKPNQIEDIYQSLWNTAKLPDTLAQKSLSNLRLKDEMGEITAYLSLCKNAEPVFNKTYYDWYEPVSNDSASAVSFKIPFLKGFIRNKNFFLKHRYGFQLMRAFFFSREYQKVIDFMKMMPKLTAQSGSIYYRALGYKAAALYHLKAYKESNLLYAQLYDEYAPQKLAAYRSFHLLDDSAWNVNIKMAETTRQKESLWQLYGVYSNPLKAMHYIYELNPNSDLLPLLAVRNVNIIETVDLRYPSTIYANEDWNYYNYKRDPFIDSNLIANNLNFDYSQKSQVLKMLHRIIEEGKVPAITPYLVSAAYLHVLSNQYKEANKLCSQALKLSSNSLIINQTEIIKAFILVKQLSQIDEQQELEIVQQMVKVTKTNLAASRAKNAINYLMFILGQKYAAQGNTIKQELCFSSSNTYYKSSDDADAMINFMEQKNHNTFESFILSRYHLNASAVYQIKGIRLLYEYNFEAAILVFSKTQDDDTLYANPFTMRHVDCHDCDFSEVQKTKYTRKTFAKKMLTLKQSFDKETNKEIVAINMFTYANALYNMTYFGNGRFIATSPILWMDDNNYDNLASLKNKYGNYYNCSEALTYYNAAKSITNNKEFAAQCTWAAAKCEQNLKQMEYITWQSAAGGDFEAGTYFQEMKAKYANTNFYKEVLSECGYFCTYITKDTACVRDKWSLRNR